MTNDERREVAESVISAEGEAMKKKASHCPECGARVVDDE